MPLPPAIADHFRKIAEGSEELGSPFTALLCRLIADRLAPSGSRFAERIASWQGDPRNDAPALRAVGGLHALARAGRVAALTAAYPPNPVEPERLWSAVLTAIAAEDVFLSRYLDGPPQTNEVARSSTILGGCLVIARETGLPLELHEVGSSAGLNLGVDRYCYDLGVGAWGPTDSPVRIASRWEGELPPLDQPLSVAARAGCDLRPIDPGSPDDRARLMSYIWADQEVRLARIEAALRLAAAQSWRVERADAADWVERQLASAPSEGCTRVLMHTIVWQYMPKLTQERVKAAIAAAAGRATATAPLAWLTVENDEIDGSAAIRLTLWPGGETQQLGRADFHGRWNRWSA